MPDTGNQAGDSHAGELRLGETPPAVIFARPEGVREGVPRLGPEPAAFGTEIPPVPGGSFYGCIGCGGTAARKLSA